MSTHFDSAENAIESVRIVPLSSIRVRTVEVLQGIGCVVRLGGDTELLPTTETLEHELCRSWAGRPQLVVVDASKLAFLSSIGLSTLVRAWRAVCDSGGRFVLAGLQPQVRGVLDRVRLLEKFEVADSVEAALGDTSHVA
jgi:anti-anti-sigma factor